MAQEQHQRWLESLCRNYLTKVSYGLVTIDHFVWEQRLTM